jgi:hypothetical protein
MPSQLTHGRLDCSEGIVIPELSLVIGKQLDHALFCVLASLEPSHALFCVLASLRAIVASLLWL